MAGPGLTSAPDVDLDRLDSGASSLPIPQSERYAEEFDALHTSKLATHALTDFYNSHVRINPLEADSPTVSAMQQTIQPDEANAIYGVDGYLRFNQETTEDDAAWRAAHAHEQRFRDIVLSQTSPTPLRDFGAGLAGSLLDPTSLAVMAGTDGLGESVVGLAGFGAKAVDAGVVASRLGRLAVAGGRTLAEGAVNNAPFVGLDAALANHAGDEYTTMDGLRDIAAGAVLHSVTHAALRGLNALGGRGAPPDADAFGPAEATGQPYPQGPDPAPAEGVPDGVQDLEPAARQGAFVKALDDATADRPVDVGQYVARELEPGDLSPLDERSAEPSVPSFRPLEEDTATTPRGTDVPVRYGLAELGDLTTSHDNELNVNPAYPAELQPRDRARAGAQARNFQLEAEMNPRLLINDTAAGAGAPIVAPDGTVESGNGRTIALRRSAASGGEAYAKYRAELKARGFDTEGMQNPVLVRMRTESMEGSQRAALAREMNADVVERMSATEQAMADAPRISDAAFNKIGPNEGPTTSRDFARDFIARVAPDQQNSLASADGTLSPEGARRIKAAVLARAYGDSRLVGQVFEDEATPVRQLGEALAEAAPAWARLRAAAARGDIPAGLDLTDALRSAMDLVRYAKQEGIGLGELLADRLGQHELFGGEAISPITEAFLRLFYRDERFTKPLAPAKIAAALRDYARQALAVTPGEDLFGETAGESTSRQILANLARKFADGEPDPIDIRPPGRAADAGAKPADLAVIDLRQPGRDGDGAGSGVSPEAGDRAGGEGQGTAAADIHYADGPGDLWRLSREDLEAMLQEAKTSDRAKLVQALGSEDAANEFERLDRRQNSSNPATAEPAAVEFNEKYGDLTPDQERLIYGVGETSASIDDIKALLDVQGDVFDEDPTSWVAYMAAHSTRGVSAAEMAAVPEGRGTIAAQVAFVRMQAAYKAFIAHGVAPKDIPREMAKAAIDVGGWTPAQASEIIGGFVDDLTRERATTAAAPEASKLGGPPQARLPAPGSGLSPEAGDAAGGEGQGAAAASDAYLAAKARQAELNSTVDRLSARLQEFPKGGSMGLTPDAVKFSPEFQEANRAFQTAFSQLRDFNGKFNKQFAAEVKADRTAARASRQAAVDSEAAPPEPKFQRAKAEQFIAADPELKALQEDTARFAAANGVELPEDLKTDPHTLAEAVAAAAFCLAADVD